MLGCFLMMLGVVVCFFHWHGKWQFEAVCWTVVAFYLCKLALLVIRVRARRAARREKKGAARGR